jgi:DNA-binding NarL/FixJ family response regulator
MKARLLIVEDHAMVREGLKYILQRADEIEVVADASSPAEALARIDQGGIDLVILDIGLGEHSGLELLLALKARAGAPKVLVVSSYPESEHGMQVLADGAAGFVSKGSTPAVLLGALRQVLAGGRYISPELSEHVALNLRRGSAAPEVLSQRERQILLRLAQGHTQTDIAAELGISAKTVHTYRARLLEKTGAASTAELIRYAMRMGLIEP